MYAIITDGCHQYKLEEGQTVDIERRDVPEGTKTIDFDRVLFIGGSEDGPKIGAPTLDGAKVTASIVGEIKGDKITIHKRRRRKGYLLKKGHRQKYLRVTIDKITA